MFWSTCKIIISTGHELHHPHYAHFTAILAIGLVSKGLIGHVSQSIEYVMNFFIVHHKNSTNSNLIAISFDCFWIEGMGGKGKEPWSAVVLNMPKKDGCSHTRS